MVSALCKRGMPKDIHSVDLALANQVATARLPLEKYFVTELINTSSLGTICKI